jgi:polar amino acid transport system substrate-binding protein
MSSGPPGSRVLDGRFTAVQQAIGTPIANANAFRFLADFVEEAGFSAKHGVEGLSVAQSN